MSIADEIIRHDAGGGVDAIGAPSPLPLVCRACGTGYPPAPIAICANCLGPLDPAYDPARRLPDRAEIACRAPTLWRYAEWLPFEGAPVHSPDSGFTPLVEAPALARLFGVASVWIKNDTVSHPTLSFKDRGVSSAINAAAAFGIDTVGCASTGNLANAVAAHAARAGLASWIFVPADLEPAKVIATTVFAPRLVRVRGTYDDVNRLCAQVADRFGWGIVNINLRAYYGEGSKTMAFEIVEQLDWRCPTAIVAPMAGGSLVTKLARGLREMRAASLAVGPLPRLYGAQAEGCAPIVRAYAAGRTHIEPVVPSTIARSLAIGAPADGSTALHAIRDSRGAAAAVTDDELIAGIRILAESTGVFAESAGGVTVAAALRLARSGHLRARDEVILCITGHGLKTAELATHSAGDVPVIAARLREVAALAGNA